MVEAEFTFLEVFNEVLDGFVFILSIGVKSLPVVEVPLGFTSRGFFFFDLFFLLFLLLFNLLGFLLFSSGLFSLGGLLGILLLVVLLFSGDGGFPFGGGEVDSSQELNEFGSSSDSGEVVNDVLVLLSLFFRGGSSEDESK